MTNHDIRQYPKQTWKECAEMYYRLWKQAQSKEEKYDLLRAILK